MKNLKKKLVAAIMMLVVATAMLGGTTYAWYTLSTNPEVTNIEANIAANENLEIALDNGYANEAAVDTASVVGTTTAQGSTTGNPYTWGNLVDLTTAMTTMNPANASSTNPQLLLSPVKYVAATSGTNAADAKLQFPTYGTDGRISSTDNDFIAVNISDYTSVTTAAGGVTGYKQAADDAKTNDKDEGSTVYDALSVTYWLRSNETCNVSLSTATLRAKSANDTSAATTDVNGVVGTGSTVTIPVSGENTATQIESYAKNLVIQFDVGTYTYYAKLTKDTNNTDAAKVIFNLSLQDVKNSSTDTATAQTIALTANTAQKVKMWIYIDGETLTNKDALLDDVDGMKINIQFASTEIGKEGTGSNEYVPGAMNGTTATN